MDLPPPVQEPGADPGPERPSERGAGPAPIEGEVVPEAATGIGLDPTGELEWRLSQLEAGLRHIDRHLDRLEESIGHSVARETQAVARDLRRTVSELGRRLVLELPQVLARHRDEIVAELRSPEPPPDTGPEPGPAADPFGVDIEAVPAAAAAPEPESAPAIPAKRRRRVHGLRQRDT